MKDMLQNLLFSNCANYKTHAYYLRILQDQFSSLEVEYDALIDKQHVIAGITTLSNLIKSENLKNVMEKDFNFSEETLKSFSTHYESIKVVNFHDDLLAIKAQLDSLESFSMFLKETLDSISERIFHLFSIAYNKKIKFSFEKNDKVVEWFLSCYFANIYYFEKRRTIIDTENSKLSNEFITAYNAEKHDSVAYNWFLKNSQSMPL